MDNDFTSAEKNVMCTEDNYSYTAMKDICKASSCIVGIAREVTRVTRTCPPTASRL